MLKFSLAIRTKDGLLVENLGVHARDEEHACDKIRKVYLSCDIVSCKVMNAHVQEDNASIENIISMISKEDEK
tara:strand:- start:88 stop:306 length:219 start_codon:yes stop_codon:yes gene_type:complete